MSVLDKYYHLVNVTTNELVFAKWTHLPSSNQLESIRSTFGWKHSDELLLKGKKKSFRMVGDTTLIFDSNISYSIIIQDRTYWINFGSNNDIDTILIVESYEDISSLL